MDAPRELTPEPKLVETIETDEKGLRVTLVVGDHDYSILSRLLVENGHALTQFNEEEINLETAFMTLTKGITS